MTARDHQHQQPQLGADHADEQQRQHHLRERQHDVGHAHHRLVQPPAPVAGVHAQQCAEAYAEQRRHRGEHQQRAAAVQEAGQHVAAEVVGAEPGTGGRVGERGVDELRRAVRCDPRTGHRDEQDQGGEPEPDLAARQAERGAQHAGGAGHVLDGGFGGCVRRRGHRADLTFGFAARLTRSASRFTTM
ncbi:hypothetical protein ACFQ0O_03095 [Saccharopolyspora spinosporotrichia]